MSMTPNSSRRRGQSPGPAPERQDRRIFPRFTRLGPAVVVLAAGLATGCATGPRSNQPARPTPPVFQKLAEATGPLRASIAWLIEPQRSYTPPRWEWAPAVPQGAVRGELIQPTVGRETVARLVPALRHQAVVLASMTPDPGPFRIQNVGGTEVHNWSQLDAAVDRATAAGQRVQVDFARPGAPPDDPGVAALLAPSTLVALRQTVAADYPVMRTADEGNPWLIIRQEGIGCKLAARVERSRGLLQVVLSLVQCWGPEAMLPVEVTARCDRQPLRCLNVAQSLELLYGRPEQTAGEPDLPSRSFAAVSQREDYLMPSNYRRLRLGTDEAVRDSAAPAPLPALASLPGVVYPGSAVLGDARALCGCLLQRQWFRPGDPERTGWILFAGPSLRDTQTVVLHIDLGRGMQAFSFVIPPP